MDSGSFDALTRTAAGSVSRRASLLTVGVAGLATLVAGLYLAEAQKG